MEEQPLHSLASSMMVHSHGMGSNPLRMAQDYCTSALAPLQTLSGFMQSVRQEFGFFIP